MTPTLQHLPISPLSIDALTRDYWGQYDAYAIAQLAPLAYEECFQPKLYKAPAEANELIPAHGYAAYGLSITPGSIIYGFYLPALLNTNAPPQWNVQITDESLVRKLWDDPIPSVLIANEKATSLGQLGFPTSGYIGAFPNLLCGPYPVVGKGTFYVELWNPTSSQQRVELVIGVLENVGENY
jgi:hypothetical protein